MGNLPFDKKDLVTQFDEELRSTYDTPLTRMREVVDYFIDVEMKSQQLARQLIGLILADCTIDDQQEFYIRANGLPCRKYELRNATEVELDGLLLGTWHYIVTKVPDNTAGRSTFERWNRKPTIPRSQWTLILGELPTIDWNISVVRSAIAEDDGFEPVGGDGEVVEAEIIEEENPGNESTASFSESVTGSSDSRITIIQGGTNNTNIGYVETLNFGR